MIEKHYLDTLVGKMAELKERGFNNEFKLAGDKLVSYDGKSSIEKDDIVIVEFFRFEGESNPSDASILYAIQSKTSDTKGLISDSYGNNSDSELDTILSNAERQC